MSQKVATSDTCDPCTVELVASTYPLVSHETLNNMDQIKEEILITPEVYLDTMGLNGEVSAMQVMQVRLFVKLMNQIYMKIYEKQKAQEDAIRKGGAPTPNELIPAIANGALVGTLNLNNLKFFSPDKIALLTRVANNIYEKTGGLDKTTPIEHVIEDVKKDIIVQGTPVETSQTTPISFVAEDQMKDVTLPNNESMAKCDTASRHMLAAVPALNEYTAIINGQRYNYPGHYDVSKEVKDRFDFQDMLLDMIRPAFEERIMLQEEIDKSPDVYTVIQKSFEKYDHMAKIQKLAYTNLAMHIAEFISTIPPDTPADGLQKIVDRLNTHLTLQGIPYTMSTKKTGSNAVTSPDKTEQTHKGGSLEDFDKWEDQLFTSAQPIQNLINNLATNVVADSAAQKALNDFAQKLKAPSSVITPTALSDMFNNMESIMELYQQSSDLSGSSGDTQKKLEALQKEFKALKQAQVFKGGAVAPSGPSKNPAEQAAKNAADVEGIQKLKKDIYEFLQNLEEIHAKHNKYKDILLPENKNLDDVQKAEKDNRDAYLKSSKNEKIIDKYGRDSYQKSSATYTPSVEVEKLIGEYKTLEDDIKKWVNEVHDTTEKMKKSAENIKETLVSTLKKQPDTKVRNDQIKRIQVIFDGALGDPIAKGILKGIEKNGENGEGLLSLITSISRIIRSEYDAIYQYVKPYAIGFMKQKGGNNPFVIKEEDKDKLNNTYEIIKALASEVQQIILNVENKLTRNSNPMMAALDQQREPSLFAKYMQRYLDDRGADGSLEAANRLADGLRTNSLIPREVLKVSGLDKTIFVFVTLFIRIFALSAVEILIERNKIQTIKWALVCFLVFYVALFALFVIFVNFDMYRMRILFNYVNFHANSGLVYAHVGFLLLFAFVIFLIMSNINTPFTSGFERIAIGEEEKTRLVYRIQLLTMIIWLFLLILIVMM